MREQEFRTWLAQNPPQERTGNWVPFIDGVRFISSSTGALWGSQFELRYFHNGATSLTIDLQRLLSERGALNLNDAEQVIDIYALVNTAKFDELLGVASPLVIKVELHGSPGLKGFLLRRLEYNLLDPEEGPSALSQNPTIFREESSTDELMGEREKVRKRLGARLFEAFGLWRPN
jgi:hypothetical protein